MAARFWVGGAGTWDNAATTHWASSTGGASGASAPTSADDVTFDANSGLSTGVTVTIAGTAAAHNVTFTGPAGKNQSFLLSGNPTFGGAVVFSGNSAVNRFRVFSSSPGATRTLTINGSHGAHQFVDFQDITIAGTAGTLTGTSIGDCQGNSGITFNASVAQSQSITAASFTWSTAAWTTRVPLPQDDVTVTGVGGGHVITADMPRLGRDIDFSAITGSASWSHSSVGVGIFGAFKGGIVTNTATTQAVTLFDRRGGSTLTAGSALLGASAASLLIGATGGGYVLGGDLQLGGSGVDSVLSVLNGTFDANGFNVSCGSVSSTGSQTRGITLGSGTWSVWSSVTATVWNMVSTGMTFSGASGTIDIADGSIAHTFAGAGFSYGTLVYSSAAAVTFTITGSNTFATLILTIDPAATAASTVSLPASGTQTVTGSVRLSGVAGHTLSFVSSAPGTSTAFVVQAGASVTRTHYSFSADIRFGYLFSALPGATAITGTAATLLRAIKLAAAAGTAALTFAAANLARGLKFAAAAGSATTTGATTALPRALAFGTAAGAVSATGSPVSLPRTVRLGALAGTTTIVAADAATHRAVTLGASASTATIAGADLTFSRATTLDALTATVTIAAADAALPRNMRLGALAGAMTVTGAFILAHELLPGGATGTLTHPEAGELTEALNGRISNSTTGGVARAGEGRLTKARHG